MAINGKTLGLNVVKNFPQKDIRNPEKLSFFKIILLKATPVGIRIITRLTDIGVRSWNSKGRQNANLKIGPTFIPP
jgi:hypothetical protein